MMRTLLKILQGVGAVLGVMFVLVMASPFLPFTGAVQTFTVRSGSMEPAIPTGSLIFVRPTEVYTLGDIVTIETDDGKSVTHRIIETIQTDMGIAFRTKGDNNEDPDPVEVMPVDIIGKTYLTLPYIGYPVAYAQTRTGFLVLIIFPAVLIVLGELVSIVREARRLLRNRKKEKAGDEVLAKNVVFVPRPPRVTPPPRSMPVGPPRRIV